MKIGITGSLSSGKSEVAKIISKKKYPLFSADKIVKNLYSSSNFKKKISRMFGVKNKNLKKEVKNYLLKRKITLKEISKIIHPYVRKKMHTFMNLNKKKKMMILEIPLLIESKLYKHFDIIILVMSSKNIRLKRYVKKGGSKTTFKFLDKNQIPQQKKIKFCDFIIVNNKSKVILKKKVNDIMYRINE